MRTTTHALTVDRIVLPRRLVQRRPSRHAAEVFEAIKTSSPRFREGDMLEFICAEGWRRYITILGIEPDGHVDAMAFDGRPHYLALTIADLMHLQIIRLDFMPAVDVAMYRRLLELDAPLDNVIDLRPV